MGQHVKCLHTFYVWLNFMVTNFISYVTCPTGLILLPLADESCMPLHCCNFSLLPIFSKQSLLIIDMEVPVSQSVEIFFLLMIIWKSAVNLSFI